VGRYACTYKCIIHTWAINLAIVRSHTCGVFSPHIIHVTSFPNGPGYCTLHTYMFHSVLFIYKYLICTTTISYIILFRYLCIYKNTRSVLDPLIYDDPTVTLICGRFRNCVCRASFFTLFSFFFTSRSFMATTPVPEIRYFYLDYGRCVCISLLRISWVLRVGSMSRADAYIICNMQGCAAGTHFFSTH